MESCRGGELTAPELAILKDNGDVKEHIKKNSKEYKHWADIMLGLNKDNSDEDLTTQDILALIQTAVQSARVSPKTGFDTMWQKAKRKGTLNFTREEFAMLIARTFYVSRQACPKAHKDLVLSLTGGS